MRLITTIILLVVLSMPIFAQSENNVFDKRIRQAHEIARTDKLKAVELIKSIYVDAEKSGDNATCARCLSTYAYWLHNEDCSHLSVNLFLKSLEICPEKYKVLRASTLSGLLHSYRMLEQNDKAKTAFNECVKLYRELGDSVGVMTAYCSYGLLFAQKGDESKAIDFYDRGLKIAKELNNERYEGGFLSNMGTAGINYDFRIECLQKSIDIAWKIDDKDILSVAYFNLAEIMMIKGEYHEALTTLDKAENYIKLLNNNDGRALECERLKAQIYSAQKDYVMACNSYANYNRLREEHERNIEAYTMTVLDIFDEEILPDGNSSASAQIHSGRNQWIAIILIVILVIAIVILIVKIRRQSLEKEKDVNNLQLAIDDAVQKRSELSTELQQTLNRLRFLTMFYQNWNQFLNTVRDMLRECYKYDSANQIVANLKKINNYIQMNLTDENEKDSFANNMVEDNEAFAQRLLERFPGITESEKQLAILMRAGLNSKEISQITGKSLKTLSMGRYRLRKELDLPSEADIGEFLNTI